METEDDVCMRLGVFAFKWQLRWLSWTACRWRVAVNVVYCLRK